MDFVGPHMVSVVALSNDKRQVRLTLKEVEGPADGAGDRAARKAWGCGVRDAPPVIVSVSLGEWQRSGMHPGSVVRVSASLLGTPVRGAGDGGGNGGCDSGGDRGGDDSGIKDGKRKAEDSK